jgi:hypothetical protein
MDTIERSVERICQPFAGSILGSNDKREASDDDSSSLAMLSKAGLTKFERRFVGGSQQNDSLASAVLLP